MTWPKNSVIAIHVFSWILFLALPLLFIGAQATDKNITAVFTSGYFLLFVFTYLFIYYFNAWVLLPALYFRRKIILYSIAVLLILASVWLIRPFDHIVTLRGGMGNWPPPREIQFERGKLLHKPPDEGRGGPSDRVDIVSIFLAIIVLAMGFAVATAGKWRSTKQKLSEAEKDKLNAELSFLKAQINPHFLFNTLNNLYTLAVTKNEKTAESILGLSNIMRYVTDDAGADFVPLQKEIDCIKDFIGLQKLRLNEKTKVDFILSGSPDNKRIAPLLLMTFVENCFKYGISNQEECLIKIEIAGKADSIFFAAKNKTYLRQAPGERKGVGIENAMQRLRHLFPGRHNLLISTAGGHYTVELTIKD